MIEIGWIWPEGWGQGRGKGFEDECGNVVGASGFSGVESFQQFLYSFSRNVKRGGDWGKGLCGMLGVRLCSCVYTDLNCVLSICALCCGLVTSVLLLSFSNAIVLVSCLCAFKDLKKFLPLFLMLTVSWVPICLCSTTLMFLAREDYQDTSPPESDLYFWLLLFYSYRGSGLWAFFSILFYALELCWKKKKKKVNFFLTR